MFIVLLHNFHDCSRNALIKVGIQLIEERNNLISV